MLTNTPKNSIYSFKYPFFRKKDLQNKKPNKLQRVIQIEIVNRYKLYMLYIIFVYYYV